MRQQTLAFFNIYKMYNYNREWYVKRYRRTAQKVTFICPYCNSNVDPNVRVCTSCGNEYHVEQYEINQTGNSNKED